MEALKAELILLTTPNKVISKLLSKEIYNVPSSWDIFNAEVVFGSYIKLSLKYEILFLFLLLQYQC